MKKSNIAIILIIFILPIVLYSFFKPSLEKNFSVAVANQNLPKVLQFTSAMCHDCQRIEQELISIRPEYKNIIIFQKIDIGTRTQQVNELMKKYNVTVVPTLVFLDKNGDFIRKIEGYVPGPKLKVHLDELTK